MYLLLDGDVYVKNSDINTVTLVIKYLTTLLLHVQKKGIPETEPQRQH